MSLPLRLFAAAATAELIAVAAHWSEVQWIVKPVLAPLLIAHVLRRQRPDLVVLALGFATAGDVALLMPGRVPFLVGMLFFLGAQVSLIVAFLRWRRPGPAVVAGFVLAWAAGNVLLWEPLGALRVPVLAYSLALALMAAAATGVSRQVGAGGVLFLLSDLLIGMGVAGLRPPAHAVLVMATYAAAIALIAVGWSARPASGPSAPTRRGEPRRPPTAAESGGLIS